MEPELAELYPVRAAAPWAEEEGRVVVLLPKKLDPVSRALRRATQGPAHLRVPLDDVGSLAWRLADGSRTAGQLADELERSFGERAGPRERALAFLGTLARNGLVLLARAPTAPAPAGTPRAVSCPDCGARFHTADPAGTRLRCPGCGRTMRG